MYNDGHARRIYIRRMARVCRILPCRRCEVFPGTCPLTIEATEILPFVPFLFSGKGAMEADDTKNSRKMSVMLKNVFIFGEY